MHLSRLALALLTCIVVPGFAVGANAKKDTKKQKVTDCANVIYDGSNLSQADNDYLFSIQKTVILAETLGFVVGNSTMLSDVYDQRKGAEFNADVLKLRELTKQKGLASRIQYDFDAADKEIGRLLKERMWTKEIVNIVSCRVAAVASTSTNAYNTYVTSYLKEILEKQENMHGQVGYFEATVNDCTISKTIETGNRYTALKQDPDARFLTVNATFKNTDNEGRLPFAGSLFISKDGKDYKFDTTETILSDGYGIRLQSLNPFIKLNTKIVYKVPNELFGDVYWKPGRNAEDKKLWCTYLPAA